MIPDNRVYSSGLSEAELAGLWADLEAELPLLYDRFLNPDYDSDNADEERKARDRDLHAFIQRSLFDIPASSETFAIHLDMKTYFFALKLGAE